MKRSKKAFVAIYFITDLSRLRQENYWGISSREKIRIGSHNWGTRTVTTKSLRTSYIGKGLSSWNAMYSRR